jgi:hypothetical protein
MPLTHLATQGAPLNIEPTLGARGDTPLEDVRLTLAP